MRSVIVPALIDGLDTVARNVEQGLNDLIPIDRYVRQARIVIPNDRDPVRRLSLNQNHDPLDEFMNIAGLEIHALGRAQEARRQRRQAIGFTNDDLGVFA